MASKSAAFRSTVATLWAFRGNITSKRGNHNFYKGRGAPTMGRIARGTDRFIIDRTKYARSTFNVPNLTGFKLKAYIAPHTERFKIARPQLIVRIDLRTKMAEEKKLRIAKMDTLLPIIKGREAAPAGQVRRSRSIYRRLLLELTTMKKRRVNDTQKQQKLASKRKERQSVRSEQLLAREAKLTKFKDEITSRHQAFLQGKRGEELPTVSPQAARYQKYKQAERFKTFLNVRQRVKNQHITAIKQTKLQKKQLQEQQQSV